MAHEAGIRREKMRRLSKTGCENNWPLCHLRLAEAYGLSASRIRITFLPRYQSTPFEFNIKTHTSEEILSNRELRLVLLALLPRYPSHIFLSSLIIYIIAPVSWKVKPLVTLQSIQLRHNVIR
jgi:hypothetical protein